MRSLLALWLVPTLLLTACYDQADHHDDCEDRSDEEVPRTVSIQVEVFDPATGFARVDATVRILQAEQEWSGCTCVSPHSISMLTDNSGTVLFDAYVLADAEIGFVEDEEARAVLDPACDQDQATVLFQVSASTSMPVNLLVPVSWSFPNVIIEVPLN